MKIKLNAFLLINSILIFFSSSLFAQLLYKFETKNLRLVYPSKAHEFVVPHLARCFENAYRFHRNLFEYRSNDKITVLLQDFGDYAGGGAGTVPNNVVSVGVAPFSYVYETMTANERINLIMNHELAHIITLDKASGSDNFFRSLFFGKVAPTPENPLTILYNHLTSPRTSAPRWYTEGIAVFMETWMGGGLGRALGAYDEMVFRTMVRDGSFFYDIVGLEAEATKVDFQVGATSYLYGTRFMSYLAYHYGPEKLLGWTSRGKNSKGYFASQFKNVYSVSLDDEWARWIAWEHQWQQANLDSIHRNPVTPHRPISQRALGSVSRGYYDSTNQKIYAAINYPGQIAHIASIDIKTSEIKKICDIKGAAIFYVASLAYDPASQTIFYTTDNNHWRDLNAVDLKTGQSKTLIKDARTGDLAFNLADRSLWGVRHFNGISTLVRIPHPYREWDQIYSFPFGKDIFDIDVSPDGKVIIAALAEIDGTQRLIKMEVDSLLKGDDAYDILFDFEISTPANFNFSPDGRYLFGSSYYSGVSNIYRYEFEKHDMSILSNGETGFFRPIPFSNDSLIVFSYTGKGFIPATIPNQALEHVSSVKFLGNEVAKTHPLVRSWMVGSPARINLDSLTTFTGKYSTLGSVRMSSMYPVVEGYKDFAAAGLRFNFADRLGLSAFDLTASYSPDQDVPADERVHVKFNFQHWYLKFRATYNAADFYDLFGPTKTSRRGYSVGIGYRRNLIYDEPRTLDWNFSVSGYGNLERLPDFQNVTATFDKLLSASTGLQYQFIEKSLGAVDDEKGVKWEIWNHTNFVNEKFFPRIFANFDYGALLPINHSSIWLRSSAGQSFGDRDDPFANFFFGGFGNNWVDRLTEKRYREYYSFPGVELNEIGGKNYGKVMLEWNLPPLRFRRFGFPALYMNWARLALFSSAIRTNLDSKANRRTLANVGAQVDFNLVLFSRQPSTFSMGYAVAKEKGRSLANEFMISLKIL